MDQRIENFIDFLIDLDKKDLSTEKIIQKIESYLSSWRPFDHDADSLEDACKPEMAPVQSITDLFTKNADDSMSSIVENLEKLATKRTLTFALYKSMLEEFEIFKSEHKL